MHFSRAHFAYSVLVLAGGLCLAACSKDEKTALEVNVTLSGDVKQQPDAVVLLEPHGREWGVDSRRLLRFLGRCFEHKRKTLRNNLAEHYGKELVDAWPEAGLRAEQITLEGFVEMYRRVAGG